ncbi:hypothetical protein [Streptomyces sp900116325]|uniref:hypothetical protein n=1 Tax=Streptomyces sp. 900116325 TaxID=3154295 RepID=UPI0033173671
MSSAVSLAPTGTDPALLDGSSLVIPPQAGAAAAHAAMAMAVQDGNCTPAEQILMDADIIPASPS